MEILHLSTLLRRPFYDTNGDRLGRVRDIVARLGDDAHPPIVGAVIRVEGRELFVPIRKIGGIAEGRLRFEGNRIDLRRFERRPGEVLLSEDLLARHAINLVHGRLITGNEIEIALMDGRWEVVGVDPSSRPALRRIIGPLGRLIPASSIVDFASIEPFVSHVPSARLRIPYRKLARLHPAQIADLVEQASHEEGEEIISAVGLDRELEADVFEELDTVHQLEFLAARSDSESARLLSRMAADNAADLISEIEQERRLSVLEKLSEPQQTKVRHLLSYNADTAGGLMTTDFLVLPASVTAAEALDAVKASHAPAESLEMVFLLDESNTPVAAVSIVSLVRSRPGELAIASSRSKMTYVKPHWDLHRVARTMSDFNLTIVPVVSPEDGSMIGAVTVDDLLEVMLPQGWRREFGMTTVSE